MSNREETKMKRYWTIGLLAGVLALSACGPVHRLTMLRRLPRQYSENYPIEGIKAPKNGMHKKPWVVYSDREGNAAYVNPGGKVKAMDVGFLDAFLVIGRKGDYLRLIKYKPENIKNNRFAERKKAEYVGWMHTSRLILVPTSVTDIRSGQKGKLITTITDTAAVMHPKRYFATADSLKVYGGPDMHKAEMNVGLHEILYEVKTSADGLSVLVSNKTDWDAETAKEGIIGWLPKEVLRGIGRRIFAVTTLPEGVKQPEVLKYSPVLRPYPADSAYTFCSGVFAPVIDKSENRVFNIDGEAITYNQSKEIKRGLGRMNVLFSIEQASRLAEQYPMLLNVIQNLRLVFRASGEMMEYRFGAAVATAQGIETIPLTGDYDVLADRLTAMAPRVETDQDTLLPAWRVMKRALSMVEARQDVVNVVIEIGETGDMRENAPSAVVEELKRKNCRVFGWQIYASAEERYNNYVLQLSDMILQVAEYQARAKRKVILYADQLCRSNLFREMGSNCYMLDYPLASMTQGGFIFPEKGEVLPLELFAGTVDSLLTQIREDNRMLAESFDRAFATVGNTKDRYDGSLLKRFGPLPLSKPGKEFYEVFADKDPMWYVPVDRMQVADSLMQFRLFLSENELASVKQCLETLCALEVDIKDINKPEKGKLKKLCRYLEQMEMLADDELEAMKTEAADRPDTTYVSTRKIRRHLRKFYLSELKNCRICHKKNRELKQLTLAEAHRQIFGVPANNEALKLITVKELKKKKVVSDAQLDALITYFKECKENFIRKFAEEQVRTGGGEYYYLKTEVLP